MRNLLDPEIHKFRIRDEMVTAYYGCTGGKEEGTFSLSSPIDGGKLLIIASSGFGWDHVSVSRCNRPPNWVEMEHVKRLFFMPEETAMQLHVPVTDHINAHPNCLHLWRPHNFEIPRPPSAMV